MNYYVYILTNHTCSVLYTGVTNDLRRRVLQHKEKQIDGFTKRYNIDRLVYYEVAEEAGAAIDREKQIKGGSRQRKMNLIDAFNATWRDLYDEIV
ncbi:MAG TPA: GIY-YIG nuclease family protein [Dehalococcoidia bacterium]|nr:GIY-YIG nuclease family protein [Dehalococcoidia bacterium]